MSAGKYDTLVEASRDFVRSITYTDEVGDPIDLTPYVRAVYNIQTDEVSPQEVLTVDSVVHPTWITWNNVGVIHIGVPGSQVNFVESSSGRWLHELVFYDSNGGAITLFYGNVGMRKAVV